MRIDVSSGEICLTENQPVSLRDARGLRIECTAGVVWITLSGQAADIFLTPGQSHRLRGDGLALIECIGDGSIRLDRPARRPGFMHRLSCLCESLWPGPHSAMSPS
jgi:hypothetical protein